MYEYSKFYNLKSHHLKKILVSFQLWLPEVLWEVICSFSRYCTVFLGTGDSQSSKEMRYETIITILEGVRMWNGLVLAWGCGEKRLLEQGYLSRGQKPARREERGYQLKVFWESREMFPSFYKEVNRGKAEKMEDMRWRKENRSTNLLSDFTEWLSEERAEGHSNPHSPTRPESLVSHLSLLYTARHITKTPAEVSALHTQLVLSKCVICLKMEGLLCARWCVVNKRMSQSMNK